MSNSQFERTPPHDIDAERSVLGGMMLSKDALADVLETLDAQDFYRPAHAIIFTTILTLFGAGQPADAITVAAELQRQGQLEQVGGRAVLHDLVSAVPTAANAAYYAHIVHDQAMLRRLVETGTRIAQLGYTTDGGDVTELLNLAQSEVYSMSDTKTTNDYAKLYDIIPGLVEELELNSARDGQLAGLSTGFHDLDKVLLGLRPNQMIIVAARPGMGKTTLAMDFCRHIAIKENKPVAFFSLEMNRNELAMRMLSAESDVWLSKLISGDLEQRDWERISRTLERVSTAPLYVDDSPNLTMMEIRSKARRMRQQQRIELIVIDYLQLLTSGGRSSESRQQEVSEFSRSIKLLAKELEIPIIAIAQLNRETERRDSKKPQVSDLRESGSLEQDADVVILINRPRERDEMGALPPAQIIVGKNRSGPTSDDIELEFQGSVTRFANYASTEEY
ncbi:replicative DNA helicase [Arcanobacterium buesumense]|uniref:Replicative DNA helicase n=1 Tax=Arcanobacterium buesumense TaxID=2722751 RepID=A0A6H2ENE1_9ACTO|nr:replicative DNA helicase [Arcanobacterium buesumense]QJC22591.1 replicative DNA helicase [Arcanobacterium buesumense]